jgi:hypothetical protein
MLSVRIAAAAGALLILVHLFLMFDSLRDARNNLLVTEKMRRLATIVIQNFPDRKGLSDEAFWKIIGRPGDPMRDHWGGVFRLEPRGKNEFVWCSNGPDQLPGTRDDLEQKVPFVDGPPPDLGPPEGYTGFPAMDAK